MSHAEPTNWFMFCGNNSERTEKDENVISLVLHIVRNLLALRDKPGSGPGSDDSDLQSDFIQQLSKFGIFDLLIHMSHGSNRFDEFGQWNMIVLDIWDHLFRGVDIEDLIDAEVIPSPCTSKFFLSYKERWKRERSCGDGAT